jgi:hypothetical protein
MSNEYNSKLIAKLYSSPSNSSTEKILDEIGEIRNPVFIYPIYEIWQSHNKAKSYITHYFISALSTIESQEVLKIAILMLNQSTTFKDKCWLFPIFLKFNYFDIVPIQVAQDILVRIIRDDIETRYVISYNLSEVLTYLDKAGEISGQKELLRIIVLSENLDYDLRAVAFRFLLRIDPTGEFKFFIDNYEKYKTDDLELITVKEILTWKGSLADKLRELLKNNGNGRVQDLITEYEKKKEVVEQQLKEVEQTKFKNTLLISDITKARAHLNQLALVHPGIEFNLFDNFEQLINQQESVNSKEKFITRSVELRDMLRSISEKTKAHNLTDEIVKNLMPTISATEYNKPLNRLFLFLRSKDIQVDFDLCGLRRFNRIVSLAAHPDQEKELIEELKKQDLLTMYIDEEWGSLHENMLNLYKRSIYDLSKLLEI